MLVTHDMGVIAETADRVAVMYAGRIVEIGPVQTIIAEPHHPYTVGLMQSIPRLGGPRERLRQIDGAMPRLDEIPPGCPFTPRCPEAFERCHRERPDLLPAPGSEAACWLYDAGASPADVGGCESETPASWRRVGSVLEPAWRRPGGPRPPPE
jgi:peptide/nickel transport system ATP-binding protein